MRKLHDIVTKKQWFLLFNLFCIIALIGTGRLKLALDSIIPCATALLIVNVAAAISARHFPDWK